MRKLKLGRRSAPSLLVALLALAAACGGDDTAALDADSALARDLTLATPDLAVAELQVAVAMDWLNVAQIEERERLGIRQRGCNQHGVVGTGINASHRLGRFPWSLLVPQHQRAPRSIVPCICSGVLDY